MKCPCCENEITYCGIPYAHFGRVLPVHEAKAPFERHGQGGFGLVREQLIVPMYDGQLILCMDIGSN